MFDSTLVPEVASSRGFLATFPIGAFAIFRVLLTRTEAGMSFLLPMIVEVGKAEGIGLGAEIGSDTGADGAGGANDGGMPYGFGLGGSPDITGHPGPEGGGPAMY